MKIYCEKHNNLQALIPTGSPALAKFYRYPELFLVHLECGWTVDIRESWKRL